MGAEMHSSDQGFGIAGSEITRFGVKVGARILTEAMAGAINTVGLATAAGGEIVRTFVGVSELALAHIYKNPADILRLGGLGLTMAMSSPISSPEAAFNMAIVLGATLVSAKAAEKALEATSNSHGFSKIGDELQVMALRAFDLQEFPILAEDGIVFKKEDKEFLYKSLSKEL